MYLKNSELHNDDDGLCPGDVFHLNFQHGHPAYFDISMPALLSLFL